MTCRKGRVKKGGKIEKRETEAGEKDSTGGRKGSNSQVKETRKMKNQKKS